MTDRFCSRLRGDETAVTVVEFALIAPVMLMLLLGAVEFGHLLFARMALEGAIMEAARAASATLETSEAARNAAMRAKIITSMQKFNKIPGEDISIETEVYDSFASTRPENYTDANGNGRYDPPAPRFSGETFTDRNANGKWDPALPKAGSLGGPGDVVNYKVSFPMALLFDLPMKPIGISKGVTLTAVAVTRNEAVVRKTS